MKRMLVLVLVTSVMCAEEVDILSDISTQLVAQEWSTRKFFLHTKMSEEKRCGDFTELVGSDWQSRTFTVLKHIRKGKAIVTIVQDSAGPLYCVKQIDVNAQPKRGYKGYVIGHIRDVLASYVFESMGIRYNKVRIIPPSVSFPGKYYQDKLATLHTFAPGSNNTHDFPYSVHLEQYMKSRTMVRDRGLTMRVIHDMSLHEDLPPMVAGNTFVSNPDQSGNNMFWDARTEKWHGIDMELAFKLPHSRNLSEIACYQIDKFLKTPGFSLNRQQYKALEQYNMVLQGLIDSNNPLDTCQLLKNIAAYARVNFNRRDHFIGSDHSFEDYCTKIHAQHNSSKKLVRNIDTLLQALRYLKRSDRRCH